MTQMQRVTNTPEDANQAGGQWAHGCITVDLSAVCLHTLLWHVTKRARGITADCKGNFFFFSYTLTTCCCLTLSVSTSCSNTTRTEHEQRYDCSCDISLCSYVCVQTEILGDRRGSRGLFSQLRWTESSKIETHRAREEERFGLGFVWCAQRNLPPSNLGKQSRRMTGSRWLT